MGGGISSLLPSHSAKQDDDHGGQDDEELIMKSAQNGSSLERSRGRPMDASKQRSYHGDHANRETPSPEKQQLPSSPEPTHGNGLVVPLDQQGSASSEHESYATPPTSMSNSRETSPTGVPDRREPATAAKPSQRVLPLPSQVAGRPGRDDSQTASDSQDIAPASSGSSSPKMWHVNPLQQSEGKKSRSPSSRKKRGNKAKLARVPPVDSSQKTGQPSIQSPTTRQEIPLIRQGSLPGSFEQRRSTISSPVSYTPPPQHKHQPTSSSAGVPVQRQRGVLTRHFSSDNVPVSFAHTPPSPQLPGRPRHYSVGDHRSAFSPPQQKQQVSKQLSLQEEYVRYENGERYRYSEVKTRLNQTPPPPPQRSSSHVWSRQISGQWSSPPPQVPSPSFHYTNQGQDVISSASQPTQQAVRDAGQPRFPQDGLTYSQPVQSPTLQQAQLPSSPTQHSPFPPNLHSMHPNQQLYYQLQQQQQQQQHQQQQQFQQHQYQQQQPKLQPAPMHFARQHSAPVLQSGKSQQVYQGYSAHPGPAAQQPSGELPLQEKYYQQKERDPSNSPPQGYTGSYPSDTAHSSTSSSRYDSETRPLLPHHTRSSTSTTTTTTTTSPDPTTDTLFYLVSKHDSKQRASSGDGDLQDQSRAEYGSSSGRAVQDIIDFRDQHEEDAFYINAEALLKDEKARRGRSLERNDPAWEDHIRRRERRRDELIRSSSQEREERQQQRQRGSSSERVTNSEQEYASVPPSPRRASRHSSRSPQRSSRSQRRESPSPRPKRKVSGSKEKLSVKSDQIPVYANVPLQKKVKAKKKEKKSYEAPVYANVPIQGDKRRQRSLSSPSATGIPKQLEVPPDEQPEYVNVPLRYDRISRSPSSWKEQYVMDYVQKSSDPDLVKRRPPAGPKKSERESPVPRRVQESPSPKKKIDSLSKDGRSLSPPTRRADSPRFSPKSSPWQRRQESPSPVRRERPRSFEGEPGDGETRKQKVRDSERPRSVHEELLMPGVVPAAIGYLRTRRGRGSVRGVNEPHQRSQSVGRVERSSNDLCYSASNLEHYARDTSDITDSLPRSWGMEMFARRRRNLQLFQDGLELDAREGFTNQAYIPDTLDRDRPWEKMDATDSPGRSRLRRQGSYEDALERGLISTSSSSPERQSPVKLSGKDAQLYYLHATEDSIPNLSNYYGKKPARHRRSEDFENALRELDEMYAKLNIETDDLYRPHHGEGYGRSKSTEVPLHSQHKMPVPRKHRKEAPSQKAKRRAQRERPHSFTAGLSTSRDSEIPYQPQKKQHHVKPSNKKNEEVPKHERVASKPRYRSQEYDISSSDEEYDQRLLQKAKSTAAVFRRPEMYDNPSSSSDSSPQLQRISLRGRSHSADNVVPRREGQVKLQGPPQRPYGKVVIPSDLSISQDDSPPLVKERSDDVKDNRELEEMYNASGLHPRLVWITDSDSMSVQRGSTEHQVSTSELEEELPKDEEELGIKEKTKQQMGPIKEAKTCDKAAEKRSHKQSHPSGIPKPRKSETVSKNPDSSPVYIRNVRVLHRAKVKARKESPEKPKSILDDPSIPLADGSEGEDEEVKALMQPSLEEVKLQKTAMTDPSSPGSPRSRQHLVERKHRGSNQQTSVGDSNLGDEEMSRTVSKLREKITSEKPLATSAERRRALFGDVGRSSSHPITPKKTETEVIGWNEQNRDSDSDRSSSSGRYRRPRTREETEKRYARLTSDRNLDADFPRRRLDSDSSDTSRGDGKADYIRKGSSASVDGYSRLSPVPRISDVGQSKSFDHDASRHSHLENNYKTGSGVTSRYSNDKSKDAVTESKYGKDYERDSQASRRALLDGTEKSVSAPRDSFVSQRTAPEDHRLSPTRQEFDRSSPLRRSSPIIRSRDYDFDITSRPSRRHRADKYDHDLDIYNRYRLKDKEGTEASERTRGATDRTERDSDLYRRDRRTREPGDTSHITSNGEISHSIREESLSSQVPKSSRSADSATVLGSLTERLGSQASEDSSEDSDARAKRIAQYKDKRRKELAEKYGIVDDLDLKGETSTRRFKYASRRSNTDLGLTSDTLKRAEELISKNRERRAADSSPQRRRMLSEDSGQADDTDYSYLRKKYGLDRDRSRTTDTTATKSKDDDDTPSSQRLRSTSLRGDDSDRSQPSQRSPRVDSPGVKEIDHDDIGKVAKATTETAPSPRTATKPNISPETQQLVDSLESKRAALRERMRQTEEASFDRSTEGRLSRRRLRREGSDVTMPAATEVPEATREASPRTDGSSAERRALRAKSAPFEELPSARKTASEPQESPAPHRVTEKDQPYSLHTRRPVPTDTERVKSTQGGPSSQNVPSADVRTESEISKRRSRSIVEAEREAARTTHKEDEVPSLSTHSQKQERLSKDVEHPTHARQQKPTPSLQVQAPTPTLEKEKPTFPVKTTQEPARHPPSRTETASERRHRFYQVESGASTESPAADRRHIFQSRDSETSIGSSTAPLESPSDSDSVVSSIASDIVRGMSPRSLEILERRRKRKEEKKAARRRSALNTPEKDVEGVSAGSESAEKSGDDSDVKHTFKERQHQLSPASSFDEAKKSESDKQPTVQQKAEKPEKKEEPEDEVDAGKQKDVKVHKQLTSPDETTAAVVLKKDEVERRKALREQAVQQESPAASAKPVKKQGQIAEGKQTKKLMERFEKAATERKGKVLAQRVEESQALLKQVPKETAKIPVEKEMEKAREPEKTKEVVKPKEEVAVPAKEKVTLKKDETRPEPVTVKKLDHSKEKPKEGKDQKKEPATKVSAQKDENGKKQPSKGDVDKTKVIVRRRVKSPTKSAEPVKVRKQAENEQRRGSISSDSSASSSRSGIRKKDETRRPISPTKKEFVGLPSKKSSRRPLSDTSAVNAKIDTGLGSRSITDPAIRSSRIEQKLQEKATEKVQSHAPRRAVSPEKKVKTDAKQARVNGTAKTETAKTERKPASRLGLQRKDSPLSSTDEETAAQKKHTRKRPVIPTVLKEAETRRHSPEPWRRKTAGSDSSDSDSRRRRSARSSGSEKEERVKRREAQTPTIKESKSVTPRGKEVSKSRGKEVKPAQGEVTTKKTKEVQEGPKVQETSKVPESAKTKEPKREEKVESKPTQVHARSKVDGTVEKKSSPVEHKPRVDEKVPVVEKRAAQVDTKPKLSEEIEKSSTKLEQRAGEQVEKKPTHVETKPKVDDRPVERPTKLEVKSPERHPIVMKSPSLDSPSDRDVNRGFLSVGREGKSSLRRTSSFKTKKEIEREEKKLDTKKSALLTKDTQLLELMRERARKIEEEEDEEMFRQAEEELRYGMASDENREELTPEQLVEKRIEKPKKLDISIWEKQTDGPPTQARPQRLGRLRGHRGKTIDIGEVRMAAEEAAREAGKRVEESPRKAVEEKGFEERKSVDRVEGKPPKKPEVASRVAEKSPDKEATVKPAVERVPVLDRRKEIRSHKEKLEDTEKVDEKPTESIRSPTTFEALIDSDHHTPAGTTMQIEHMPHVQMTKSRLRRQSPRFRTQPITKPEYVAAKEQIEPTEATAVDSPARQPVEEDSAKDELSQMSVSEKRKLFIQKQKELEAMNAAADTKRKPRRFQKRLRSSERSQTQPVTQEEVKTAVTLGEEEEEEKTKAKIAEEIEKAKEDVKETDELSQLSLADKMNLFKEKTPEKPPPKVAAPTRKKRQGSRFKTQPVTIEELQRAKKISPLAVSFSKPPDPELLATLSLSDQIALVYGDKADSDSTKPAAEQPGAAATQAKQDQPKSALRRSSVSNLESNKGILKDQDKKDDKDKPRGILKSEKSEERDDVPKEVRSILKPERRDSEESVHDRVKGILKSDRHGSGSEKEDSEKGILKKKDSFDSPDEGSPRRSTELLKKPDKGVLKHRDSGSDVEKRELVGVLKHKDSPEEKEKTTSPTKSRPRSDIAESRKSERFQTQPIESPEKTQKRVSRKLSQDPERHKTQPITVQEVRAASSLESMKPSSSISDRLSALQQSGETGWRKRISKFDEETFVKEIVGQNGEEEEVKLREKSNGGGNLPRPQSIAERLQQLQSCDAQWKGRVEGHDAEQYTVAGKMTKAGKDVQSKHASRRPRKSRPLSGSFKLPTDNNHDSKEKMPSAKLADKQREEVEMKIYGSSSSSCTTTPSSSDITSESDVELQPTAIEILKPDNEDFAEFFKSTSVSVTKTQTVKSETKVEVSVSDFDVLTEVAKPPLGLVGQKRALKPQRRTKASSNPLRALQARSDVKSEYTEIRTDVAVREVKRMKKEQIEKESTFASSALAGLASTEDFSSVSLRKTSEAASADAASQLLPYKELMLLHIKGRRNVQVRLVEPTASSLSTGDSYVLVTPKSVFLWQGAYANVIEKAKAAEISQVIQTKRDLGCKATSVSIIDEEKGEFMGQYRIWKTFWQLLGGREKYKDVGPPEEDENHELYLMEANMVYKVQDDSLVPYEEYWGSPPKVEMLNSSQVLVFDFGSELYIWQGRQSSLQARKRGIQLAKQLWAVGFDYSDCDVNPLYPLDEAKPKKGQRPTWALFAKVNERMETVLFRNKFQDWPDDSRIIKVKSADSEKDQKSEIIELKPYDAKSMVAPNKEKPYFVFEGVNVGRGVGLDSNERKEKQIAGYYDKIEKRGNVITTLSVVTWHVLEYEHSIVPKESFGQLHEGDTYVVRWQFRVEAAAMKDLKGNISKRAVGHGKEKCAYFFWQGSQSTINEKGASALMTVELDEERGPQIRVVQGKEPPVFLHLFQGALIMHIGKREEEETNTQGTYRLYCVRGEEPIEGFLTEVPRSVQHLRSRMSLLLLNLDKVKRNQAEIILWHGCKALETHRKIAKLTAKKLQESRPLEAGLNSEVKVSITEMEEGDESPLFWKAIGGKPGDRGDYDCLLDEPLEFEYTPRLFHLTSQSGAFEANEILNSARSDKSMCAFPFLQSEMYNVSQPAQFLFDNNSEVFLWQGWWPEDEDEAHYGTGSAKMRWDLDRKLAMETVMDYCKERNPKSPLTAYIINAGLEPKTFTNLFPYWHCREDIAEINQKEGKSSEDIPLVKDVLAQLTKSRYTIEELTERPLPEGVDPSKLETYLSDEEFQDLLEMSKDEFYQLPPWKQNNLKKDVGLF